MLYSYFIIATVSFNCVKSYNQSEIPLFNFYVMGRSFYTFLQIFYCGTTDLLTALNPVENKIHQLSVSHITFYPSGYTILKSHDLMRVDLYYFQHQTMVF